jgi:hypothetical protein
MTIPIGTTLPLVLTSSGSRHDWHRSFANAITDSAKDIGQRASDHYEHARNRFGEAVDALTNTRAL